MKLLAQWNGRVTELLLVRSRMSISLVGSEMTRAEAEAVAAAHGLPLEVRPGAFRAEVRS